MNKIITIIIILIIVVYLISSCNKDKTSNIIQLDCSIVDSTVNTYDLQIKSIMNNNCATPGCHDATTASATIILDNYTSTKDAVENKNVLCAMKYETNCVPMPPLKKLNDTLINYVNCWKEAGFPR